jgi:hypothetical protein
MKKKKAQASGTRSGREADEAEVAKLIRSGDTFVDANDTTAINKYERLGIIRTSGGYYGQLAIHAKAEIGFEALAVY